MPRAWFTTHDAAIMLGGIDDKTLRRWADAAGIRPIRPRGGGGSGRDGGGSGSGGNRAEDRRVIGWTLGELSQIARFKGRVLGRPPAESETARTLRLEKEIAALRTLVEQHIADASLHGGAAAAPARYEPHRDVSRDPPHAPPHDPAPERAQNVTRKLVQSPHDTLPLGWEAPQVWAQVHGLPIRTVNEAIRRGKVPAPKKGTWQRGRGIIKNAWDEEQQALAEQHWRQLGRIP